MDSRRVRMTLVYEFDYIGELDADTVTILVDNFYRDPTAFIADPAWDESILVAIDDITDEDE